MTILNVLGEQIREAESLAEAKFLNCPWQFFDGVPDKYPNQLVWGDFAIMRVMNSGINDGIIPDRADIENANAALARISLNEALAESAAPPYEQVHALFKAMRTHQFGRSRIAKVLCRKRPNLIPMLDSVVTDFLQMIAHDWAAGRRAGKPSWFDEAWHGWSDRDDPTMYMRMTREALAASADVVRQIRAQLAAVPFTGVPEDAPLLRIWEATIFWHLWSA